MGDGGWCPQVATSLARASLTSMPRPCVQQQSQATKAAAVASSSSGNNSSSSRLHAAAMATPSATAPAVAAPLPHAATDDPKLAALREALLQADGGRGVQAFIVPSEDPHMVGGCGWVGTEWEHVGASIRWGCSGVPCVLCRSPAGNPTPNPFTLAERVPPRVRRPPRLHLRL